MTQEMMEALHPDPNKRERASPKRPISSIRQHYWDCDSDAEEGIYFSDLPKAVEPYLTEDVIRNTSTGWWDNGQARFRGTGLIERVPGKGKQRLRRVQLSQPHQARPKSAIRYCLALTGCPDNNACAWEHTRHCPQNEDRRCRLQRSRQHQLP